VPNGKSGTESISKKPVENRVSNSKEKELRKKAIQDATKNAIEVPLKVMQLAYDSLEVLKVMAKSGNPNSVSDAGVGALCARTAVEGAYLNVKINASGFNDLKFLKETLNKAEELLLSAKRKEQEILKVVYEKIGD